MNRNFYGAVIFMTALFLFQSFDVPPPRNAANPKTCCGRAVCMCSHAKGAHCPFRQGTTHPHPAEAGVKAAGPLQGIHFTKAPCASHAPKTTLPEYSKDFVFPVLNRSFDLKGLDFLPVSARGVLPLPRDLGIDRPPRVF